MTFIMDKTSGPERAGWSGMPGWNITVDLTPPELRVARSLVILRRWIAGALGLVLVLCVASYVLAMHSNSAAQRELDAATAGSTTIQATIAKHSAVTQVQTATSALDAQLSTLFADEVDVPELVAEVSAAGTGDDIDITSLNVTTSSASALVDPETGTDTIGTVTMSGTSRHLVDLATYVTALGRVKGVTDVIPSTNSAGTDGGSWSLTLQLTSALYTHRFAAAATTSSTDTGTTSSTGGN